MSLEDPVIITCAISGALANRDQCPAIPYTPEEYAAEARRIVDEGGVHIHIHARRPDGTPSYEIEDFRAIRDAIRAEVGRRDHQLLDRRDRRRVEKRVAYLRAVPARGRRAEHGLDELREVLAPAQGLRLQDGLREPVREIIELLKAMNELGIKPEHECFDVGHVGSLAPLIDMGAAETRRCTSTS